VLKEILVSNLVTGQNRTGPLLSGASPFAKHRSFCTRN